MYSGEWRVCKLIAADEGGGGGLCIEPSRVCSSSGFHTVSLLPDYCATYQNMKLNSSGNELSFLRDPPFSLSLTSTTMGSIALPEVRQ